MAYEHRSPEDPPSDAEWAELDPDARIAALETQVRGQAAEVEQLTEKINHADKTQKRINVDVLKILGRTVPTDPAECYIPPRTLAAQLAATPSCDEVCAAVDKHIADNDPVLDCCCDDRVCDLATAAIRKLFAKKDAEAKQDA